MVPSRGQSIGQHSTTVHPPALWESLKDEIQHYYLAQNMTLEDVRDRLQQHGFYATIRQYKTKLKDWGFDTKKIKGELWKAMSVVMAARQSVNLTSQFIVPFRGDQAKLITADAIIKQMRRNSVPAQDVDTAYMILRRNNVSVQDTYVGTIHQQLGPSASINHEALSQHLYFPQLPPPPPPPLPSLPPSHPPAAAGHLFTPNSLPPIDQYIGNMQLRPTEHVATVSQPSSAVDSNKSFSFSTPDNDFDLTSALGQLSTDPSCNQITRDRLVQYIGFGCWPSTSGPLDEEKKLAAKWAAYYLLRSGPEDAGTNTADGLAARATFHTMLTQHSNFIFPYCNWMLTVLASQDKTDLLKDFLRNCCEVINQDEAKRDLTYGAPFHFALALYTEDHAGMKYWSEIFKRSTNAIGLLWGRDSPNYLINQYHLAWHELAEKHYDEALTITKACLPVTERVMGRRNLVTINCLTISSRIYEGKGDIRSAIRDLREAVNRLADAPRVLHAYKYRQLRRLALLEIKNGETVSAERRLVEVMEFRVACFGIGSPMTWQVIEDRCQMLESHGRGTEAEDLRSRMHAQWEEHNSRSHAHVEGNDVSGTWICGQCHEPGSNAHYCVLNRRSSSSQPSRCLS